MYQILNPVPADLAQAISEGILRSNQESAVHRENFAIAHRAGDVLVGGVTASVSFAVLFINNIWVEDRYRLSAIGSELMRSVENEGRRRAAKIACVDTLSTQAPSFYAKLGYEEFARLAGEIDGKPLDRIWFHKML